LFVGGVGGREAGVEGDVLVDQGDDAVAGGEDGLGFGVDEADGIPLHLLVNEAATELTGAAAKGNADVGDVEPEESAVEEAKEVSVVGAEARGGVGDVGAAVVEMEAGAFADVGADDLGGLEGALTVAGVQLPPVIALVSPLAQGVGKAFQMRGDGCMCALEPGPSIPFGRSRSPRPASVCG
jgi:hypothetical protein